MMISEVGERWQPWMLYANDIPTHDIPSAAAHP
jgi:hypothetical protein